jgi:hypothetical protein
MDIEHEIERRIVAHTEGKSDIEETVTLIMALIDSYSREERIDELEKLAEQYGEFRDGTTGKTIDLKAVTLYRITSRIKALKEAKQNLSDNCQICGDGGHTEFDCPNTGKLSEEDDEL